MTEKEYLLVKTASGIDSFIDWLEKGYLKSVVDKEYIENINPLIYSDILSLLKATLKELHSNIETKEDE